MLTRIYGIAFADKETLKNYVTMLEEAKKETIYVRSNPLRHCDPTGKATDANSWPSPEEIKQIANKPPVPETPQQKLVGTLCMAPLAVVMGGTAAAQLPAGSFKGKDC